MSGLLCLSFAQLQTKFENLKKMHADEKKKIDDKRRMMEEEALALQRRKASVANAMSQSSTIGKKKK